MSHSPPDHPAGPFVQPGEFDAAAHASAVEVLRQAPAELRTAVAGLSDAQLDTLYRNWSLRQIVHHLADSHLQAYSRTKWGVTEEHPTIKPYDESAWSELTDARTADVAESLALLSGLHARWCLFLVSLTTEQLARTFYHPESREDVPVWRAVQQYAWHARHHTAQIVWRRQQQGW